MYPNIIATIISDNCKISDEDIIKYKNIIYNSSFKWDTSTLPAPSKLGNVTRYFRRIMERNIILFLYLLIEKSPTEIYRDLGGTIGMTSLDQIGEKTIENGFRYSYFLSDFSYNEDIVIRRKKFSHIIQNQIPKEDKVFLYELGNTLIDTLKSIGCSNIDEIIKIETLRKFNLK